VKTTDRGCQAARADLLAELESPEMVEVVAMDFYNRVPTNLLDFVPRPAWEEASINERQYCIDVAKAAITAIKEKLNDK
jgi:hypothetical protein